MAACFRPASPAAGPAAWPSAGRRGYRGGGIGGGGGGGAAYVGPYSSLTTTPVIAVGFKRLHAGYTGPLVRLLRADDDAEMDFDHVTGNGLLDATAIAMWLGASTGLGLRWYNQYSAGEDYVQTTKAAMPTFDPAGLNGGPCFTFDGSNDYMIAELSTNMTDETIYNVALAKALAGRVDNDGCCSVYNNAEVHDYNVTSSISLGWEAISQCQVGRGTGLATTANGTAPSSIPLILSSRADGSNCFAGVNGTEAASANVSTGNFDANRAIIGARWTSSQPLNFGHQSIAGVANFGVDPGISDRGIVINFLKTVGGIA